MGGGGGGVPEIEFDGGGGGGAGGVDVRAAEPRAAISAKKPLGLPGMGGAEDEERPKDGIRGAPAGGGGGAAGGAGAENDGGGGGAAGGVGANDDGIGTKVVEGFRPVGGGIGGFFPVGGAGLGFNDIESEEDDTDKGDGRILLVLKAATGPAAPGIGGAGDPGGLGALPGGGRGVGAEDLREDVSGSERYADSLFAPVLTPPPLDLSFGMPPANIPPSCGAALCEDSMPGRGTSLLALALLAVGDARPGIGGAPPTGGPLELSDPLATMGADLSLVTAFFNCFPFVMSPRRAPCTFCQLLRGLDIDDLQKNAYPSHRGCWWPRHSSRRRRRRRRRPASSSRHWWRWWGWRRHWCGGGAGTSVTSTTEQTV